MHPYTVTLMNLSHEFTRGVSYKREAQHWRETLGRIGGDCVTVANADDPSVVWAVGDAPRVVWVAGGLLWKENALVCRGCLLPLGGTAPGSRARGAGSSVPSPRGRWTARTS